MLNMASSSVPCDTLMICHPSMSILAKKINDLVAKSQGKRIVFKEDIHWKFFEDGYPNIFIDNIEECSGKHVIYLGSFYSPSVVFEQLSVLYALPKYSVRSLTFVLPFFPTGTMERVDTEGQIATASTTARLLSATPLTAMGPTQLLTYDIHALQERFYFTDNIIPRLMSAVPRFLQEVKTLKNANEKVAIAFPDEGAHKRFHTYFKDFPVIRCIKRRRGKDREITIVDGNPENHHVIIVDDLVNTGGTVLECISCMKSAKASKVSVYVTHPVFPRDSWKKFIHAEENLNTPHMFWITDSLPHALEIVKYKPFQLISLAPSICAALGVDIPE
uniref:ribose-phosphate pyrophosphokinase 4-like n=1 Tax=Styela clava TaxID=7725 RepID=UPI00193A28AE|nr:ribose-phosphate pyrophosphokinase 4-like [Styela clava]